MTYIPRLFRGRVLMSFVLACVMCLVLSPALALAQQSEPAKPDQSQTPKQQQQNPSAGGPQGDIGPIAVPKKKPTEEKPPEKPEKVKNPAGLEDFSLRVNVPLVSLDV